MKKFVFVAVLAIILAVGAFAEHPSGWGIGVVGQYNWEWDGFYGAGGAALALKAPQYPIFWGINARLGLSYFNAGVTGDYYIVEGTIIDSLNFCWYVGLGGYANFYSHFNNYNSNNNYTGVGLGARVPGGVYIMPLSFIEVFMDLAPSLGLGLKFRNSKVTPYFPSGSLGFDIGVRFWL